MLFNSIKIGSQFSIASCTVLRRVSRLCFFADMFDMMCCYANAGKDAIPRRLECGQNGDEFVAVCGVFVGKAIFLSPV